MIARVALADVIYAIDKPYDYLIPQGMALQPGQRVMVPFGQGNRNREALVLELTDTSEAKLKPVLQVLDKKPVISPEMLRLAAFVRQRCFCTFYDAIRCILPTGLWIMSRQLVLLNTLPEHWEQKIEAGSVEHSVIDLLKDAGGQIEEATLQRQFPDKTSLQSALEHLRKIKLIRTQTDLLRKDKDKTEQIVELTATAEEVQEFCIRRRKTAPMQIAVLELLRTVGAASMKELKYFTGASTQTVRSLEKNGMARICLQEVLRRTEITPSTQDTTFRLNPEQQVAFDGLNAQMNQPAPGVALLYGVTGAGKTAVYIQLIRSCLAAGKTALMLVPEIALTPQLMSLFVACFGEQVAVLHSALRVGERFDEYKRIARGEARVVVGTRSAVFAPLEQLGLIVLDEEQEHTYKSENSPRYHAREVAIYRGSRNGALVLLGSATPSVESMYHARTGDYRLFTLSSRFNGKTLPQAELVDMKPELRAGNSGCVSSTLLDAIRANLLRKEKTILLLNRRGGNRLAICTQCGYVPRCPRCSVNLTYHMANHRLMCHYCGYSDPLPPACPECGGRLKGVGFGTQQLQAELEQLLPGVTVLRMDADTITPTNPHEAVLSRFEKEDIPILVGTQMVAKGLNFPDVTLVGVVDADMSLYVDHYRAGETTFSLITQVVGRSGRFEKAGRALIQTMTPKNQVLLQAARQDYDAFYETEISLRRLRSCPPFADLIQVGFSSLWESQAQQCAARFAGELVSRLRVNPAGQDVEEILGPAPSGIMKINNKYRYRLTVCCKNTPGLRQLLSAAVKDFPKQKESKGCSIWVDVNGYE